MTTRVTSSQPDCDYKRRESRKSLPTISVLTLEIAKKPEKQPEKEEDPDTDVLSDLIGNYGLWQFVWTLLLTLFQLPNTLHIFSLYFQGNDGDFWCARPKNMSWIDVTEWRNKTQPDGPCTIRDYILPSDLDQSGWKAYFNGPQNTAADLVKCESFEYDNAAGTIVAEWNLVCDREILSTYVETCFLTGAAIGSVSSGWLSDKFGRKHTLMTFALVQNIIGTAIAFSNSLAMFMALRLIIGFASMTVTVVSFVLVAELVSGKCRTIIGILNIMPVGLTYTITSGIAYLTKDWRLMQLVIAIPWFSFSFMWFCLPESPRWLLERGRTAELIKIIERAAKMNKRILPFDYEKSLETCPKNDEIVNESPLKVVFNKEFRKTTLLTLVVWFTLILIYMGLTLHIKNMGGDIYLTAALAGIVEAVAVCLSILVVLRLGIKFNLVIYTLISAVACLAVNLVPDDATWITILLAMIVKCAIGANNAIIPIFTAKQYPTMIRNFGVGMGNFACGIALMLVPSLWQLESIEKNLPMTVLGISGMIGAVALIFMKQVEGVSR